MLMAKGTRVASPEYQEYVARKLAEDPMWLEKERARTREWQRRHYARQQERRAARTAADPDWQRRYFREYYGRNVEKYRERARRQNKKRYGYLREFLGSPEQVPKEKARSQFHSAVRNGTLKKPTHCPKCGAETPSRRMHGHHADYSKPLDVEWRCSRCHGKEHRKS